MMHNRLWILCLCLFLCLCPTSSGDAGLLPVVILHGYSASASNLQSVDDYLTSFGLDVYNIEIGNGVLDSMFMPVWRQLLIFNDNIKQIPQLRDGFNMVCMSQGAVICRGYIEMFNNPPVRRFISWVGPHGGVYNPDLDFPEIYKPWSQEHNSFSNYWRDPYRLEEYIELAHYLPIINLDRPITSHEGIPDGIDGIEPKSLVSLEQLVLIWSPNDDVLGPPSSGAFGHYEVREGQLVTVPLMDSLWYWEDRLGLRTLNETNRLHIFQTECEHHQHVDPSCFPQLENNTLPWLLY